MLRSVAAVLLLMLCACDTNTVFPPVMSKAQYCTEVRRQQCKLYWKCMDPPQRESLSKSLDIGTSEADCLTKLVIPECATGEYACPTGFIYQEMKAGACVLAIDDLSCESRTSPDPPNPPACMRVCLEGNF